MHEHHLTTTKTARYYTLGNAGNAAEIWMVLHGYAQLARYFIRSFASIDDGSRLIVAPEALNRYYFETAPGSHARNARVAATWMTREDREHEIEDYIAYLDNLADRVSRDAGAAAVPVTLTVLGFSQGAATASRWAARGRTRIDRVILWGSALAYELVPAPNLLRGASLTIAVGDADANISDARIAAEHARLSQAGLQHELIRYAGGHSIEAAALAAIAVTGQNPPP